MSTVGIVASVSSAPADRRTDGPADAFEHLESVPDGSGCTEIWEHLSERRSGDPDDRGA